MTLTTTTLRNDIKTRFRITDTSLDTDIDTCVSLGVDHLNPDLVASSELDYTILEDDVTDGRFYFGTTNTVRMPFKVFYKSSSDTHWSIFTDWSTHSYYLYFADYVSVGDQFRVMYTYAYSVSSLSTVSDTLRSVILDYASSEFCTLLAGDKSRYSIYAQSNGARSVDNMLDLATFYDQKASNQARRLTTSEGVS